MMYFAIWACILESCLSLRPINRANGAFSTRANSNGRLDTGPAGLHLERMDAALTLAKLIGPIAAATILNVFLFALAWCGHQPDRPTPASRNIP